MGLLKWLLRTPVFRPARITRARVRRELGPWMPYTGADCLPRTQLPPVLSIPARVGGPPDGSPVPFSQGLFLYWLRVTPAQAGFLASRVRAGKMYRLHYRPRKGKSPREIAEPEAPLKYVQRLILTRLLEQMEMHSAAHGFVKGRSIFTHAARHTGREIVICLDLRDFFPSITFPRVVGFFRHSGFDAKVSVLLASLCCREGRLPQGAPTSPMLSNLICRRLDARLDGLVRKHGGVYSRYADDLTLSGPASLVSILPLVRHIIKDEGFATAPEKLRIQRRGRRQEVTGLVVNDRVGVPRRVRRYLRAMVHRQSLASEPDFQIRKYLLGFLSFMRPAHQAEADGYAEMLGVYR